MPPTAFCVGVTKKKIHKKCSQDESDCRSLFEFLPIRLKKGLRVNKRIFSHKKLGIEIHVINNFAKNVNHLSGLKLFQLSHCDFLFFRSMPTACTNSVFSG